MNLLRNVIDKFEKLIFHFKDGLIRFFLIIISVICIFNMTYIITYLIPLLKISHVFASSDLSEFVLGSVGLLIVFMVAKRQGFLKSCIKLIGPLSVVFLSAKFIYVFHSTRDLFIDKTFFKIFGFLFSHSYTKEEYLSYGFSYLKNKNGCSSLYPELSSLYDTHSVESVSYWTSLLDSLLDRSSTVAESSSSSFLDQLLNFTSTCTSFVTSHPYIFIGSLTCLCLVGIGFWYKSYPSTTVNSPQSEVISHGNDISKILLERDDFVLSETQLALSDINILHKHVKDLANYSVHLYNTVASISLFFLDTRDTDLICQEIKTNATALSRLTANIIKLMNKDFQKPVFPGEGQKLGHGPLKLEERAARLARFEKGLNPTDNEN